MHKFRCIITSMPPPKMNRDGEWNSSLGYSNAESKIRTARLLKGTTFLDLSGLYLAKLPPDISHLAGLTALDLEQNLLTTLPPDISQLKALEGLNLQDNLLSSLPAEVVQLPNLKKLLLRRNNLATLPPEIVQLTKLSHLGVESNHLVKLPKEVGQFAELETLNLSDNHLLDLPPELGQITSLTQIYLHNNPRLGLPSDVLGPTYDDVYYGGATPASARAILDYYFERQAQGEAPMQEVRVLLLGRGRVGKTSLLKVLQGQRPDPLERETPGITVDALDLKCTNGVARAHVWDFGGQEFLHGTHQIFLSTRCVYVLVLEGRVSNWEMETDYWLRFIQSYGSNSPVVIALNKYDLHRFSVDRFRLQERCPQIIGFVETDAIMGRGIQDLRAMIEQAVDGMIDVWVGVPKNWHRVKQQLTTMPQNYLEYVNYQALCVAEGITEERQQESLAEALHRLGVALNFRDHHRLRHTSVLKPQWVTEGIYGLLRFAQKQDCHGMLKREWIGQALPPIDYPPEKHAFVMELMEKFEVAFPLDTKDGTLGAAINPQRWLIPELLPEVQPRAFEEFRKPGVNRLRFTYPGALPPGLLPRLIVRTHEMSETHAEWRWRSGVVLEWSGCRALVRLDRTQRRTEVAVMGDSQEGRQSLFDIIRAHLTLLHAKVPVVEEVQALEVPEKWVEMRELRMAERDNDETFKVTVGKDPDTKRVALPVAATLNTVESEAARSAASPGAKPRIQLFISYAHANDKEVQPFRQHLTHLSQQGFIQVWHDRDLVAGEMWEAGIMEALNRADIILLFYTTAARISKFIQTNELVVSLDRSDAQKCTLIWVPLERNDLDINHPLEKRLKKLQCATKEAKPIYDFDIIQKGWMEVEMSIRRAVEKRRQC